MRSPMRDWWSRAAGGPVHRAHRVFAGSHGCRMRPRFGPRGSPMARKPKALPSTESAAPLPEENVSALVKASPAARRGRTAEATASLSERLPAVDSDEAMQAASAPESDAVDASDMPARGRSGRKPKQPAGVTAASLPRDDDAERQGSGMAGQADEDVGTAPVVDDDLIVEAALSMEGPSSSGAADMDAEPRTPTSDPARSSYNVDTSVPSKPAAHWDRATDTVQFDWPEIERTAAQPGPNQGMAKLLVAARAEGANSRWPF